MLINSCGNCHLKWSGDLELETAFVMFLLCCYFFKGEKYKTQNTDTVERQRKKGRLEEKKKTIYLKAVEYKL